MGTAPYSNETYAYIFWYILGTSLALMGIMAWSFELITRVRLRANKRRHPRPASTNWLYTPVSILREASSIQLRIPYAGKLPTTGNAMLCGIYIAILLCCLLSDIWAPIPVFWEAMALRSGYLSVAQLALVVAISAKKNLIAYLLHSSHERIIVFHRLVGICILVTATLHMGYFLREWLYYDVWKSQWQEMGVSMLQWGFAAWGILVFIFFTSLYPIRKRFYEPWLILHIISMVGFFAMVYMHLDPPYRGWVYAPIAIWVCDRLWRFCSRLYLNMSPRERLVVKGRATVEAMVGGVTRITVRDFALKRSPGQYAYLSIYSLGLNSHPFTIVSSQESSDLVFVLKAKSGLTRKIHEKAGLQLPPDVSSYNCSLEGPYGGSHTRLQAFDTAFLIAGGVGATFIVSLLQDLTQNPGCCRNIRFIWAVKSDSNVTWFSKELSECSRRARQNNITLEIEVYVTCDANFVFQQGSQPSVSKCTGNCRCRSITPLKQSSTALRKEAGLLQAQGVSEKQDMQIRDDEIESVGAGCCCSRQRKPETTDYLARSYGRPDIYSLLSRDLNNAYGETGVVVCGPDAMTLETRGIVVRLSDERAVKKGTGAEAIYLHVENQS